jgi:flagellar biogenesis protein FliO
MPSLIALIGTCLTAAVTAAAGDRDAAPWWSNPSADAPAARPQAAPYGSAVADGTQAAVTALPPPGAVDGAADFAPDPPSRERAHRENAVFAGPPATNTFPERAARTETVSSSLVRLATATEPVAEHAKKDKVSEAPAPDASNVLRALPVPAASGGPRPITPPAASSPASAPAVAIRPITPPAASSPASAPAVAIRPITSPAASAAAPAPSLTLGGHVDKGILGKTSPLSAMFTVGGSLSIVLGLFLVIAWAMRKTAPRGSLMLPKEVFEILGRAPLGARQQVQLLRCGSKLLLVSITPQGTETLTEVTDPLEVDRIAGICQQGNPKSSSTAFRQVFQQIASTPGKTPPDDDLQLGGARRKRYRWEEKHA